MFSRNRSQPAHERTAEERQRAREERERHRQGLPPQPEAPAVEESATVEVAAPPPVAEQPPTVEEPPTVEQPPTVEEPPTAEVALPPVVIEEPTPPVEPPPRTPARGDSRLHQRVERLHQQRADSHRWYRRLPARLGALLALAAVGGAIWLLTQSLGESSHPKLPPAPRVLRIAIPEGFTRAQIAELAKADHLKGNYLADSVHSSLVHPTRYGARSTTPSLEGFLFPATYDLYTTSSSQRLVDEQLLAFRENFGTAEIHRAHALGVSPYELLTIASMIEREAEVQRDRPLIAAAIYNRLHQGMPLGIDATIRYALNDFSQPLTEAQLHNPSPYNTRLHTGLPPTPISNPGRASIQAAAHPAHVAYLYYVAAPDGCGEHVFSTSFAQFEHDAAAYREAVAKNHGNVPTCHKK